MAEGYKPEKPEGWEVKPDKDVGVGEDGYHYYALKDHIFRTKNGYTSLVCSEEKWESSPWVRIQYLSRIVTG